MEYAETNPTFDPRWAIYASGPDQAYLDAQVQRLREVARDILGFTTEPGKVWRDTVADQPERDDMLRSFQDERFHSLLVVSPSQVSQDIGEVSDICRRISRAGGICYFLEHYPCDSRYDPTLMDFVAFHDKRIFRQQIKRGLEHAAKGVTLPGGPAPFGYELDPATKTFRINPVEAPVLQRMFEMAAGVTPAEIAQTLNEQGIPTRTGWRWTSQGVRRILKNKTCTGVVEFMGIRIGIIPIITREVFARVQRTLGQRRTSTNPRLVGMLLCDQCSLLAGMAWCGRCGERMTGMTGMTGMRTAQDLRYFRYYRCASRPLGCGSTSSIRTEVLEKHVWSKAEDLVRDPSGTVEAIRQNNGPITQKEEQRITDWCRRTAPLLDGMDNAGKRAVLKILGVHVTVKDSSESIQIRLKPHLNPDGDGDDNPSPATS